MIVDTLGKFSAGVLAVSVAGNQVGPGVPPSRVLETLSGIPIATASGPRIPSADRNLFLPRPEAPSTPDLADIPRLHADSTRLVVLPQPPEEPRPGGIASDWEDAKAATRAVFEPPTPRLQARMRHYADGSREEVLSFDPGTRRLVTRIYRPDGSQWLRRRTLTRLAGTERSFSNGAQERYLGRDSSGGRRFEATRVNGTRVEFVEQDVVEDPIILDLDGDGVRTAARRTLFDIDGDGGFDRVSDISPGDGILVLDVDRDGAAGQSGAEVLGNSSDLDGDGRGDRFPDGFEALEALVRKAARDGVLRGPGALDARLDSAELAALEQAFGLRVRVGGLGGRDLSFAAAGVSALLLSPEPARRQRDFDGRGNDLVRQPGAEFTRLDGSRGSYAQVWLRKDAAAGAPVAR